MKVEKETELYGVFCRGFLSSYAEVAFLNFSITEGSR
jgi:hypothetical protein